MFRLSPCEFYLQPLRENFLVPGLEVERIY
jgi:hypothetical protein